MSALTASFISGCSAVPTSADPLPTLDAIRAGGCDGRPGAGSLRPDAQLDRVAARLTGDAALADAISAERLSRSALELDATLGRVADGIYWAQIFATRR